MPFTAEEKVSVRSHLGFLNAAENMTFVLGTPAAVETQFVIEGAMNRILEAALPLARDLIGKLDTTLAQMLENQEVLVASKVGEIEIDPEVMEKLEKRYAFWQGKLADLLGVYVNPFSKVGMGIGLNIPVQH